MPGVGQVGIYPWSRPMPHTHQNIGQGGQLDHGLANLGLADDDHIRYFDRDGAKDLTGTLGFRIETYIIVAGSITPLYTHIRVATEGGVATDNLDNISSLSDGTILYIRAYQNTETVVIRHGVGNINCGSAGDITLDDNIKEAKFIYNGAVLRWVFIGYSNILTKARIDALAINADQVDGEEANAITTNARVKAHFPDTIANILSNHTKAVHDALGILHSSTGGRTANDHHAQLHENQHEVGGGDLVNHDALTGFAASEHLSLPNIISNVLSNHTKAIHDALKIESGYLGPPTGLTINAGAITVTKNYHKILGQGGAADDLDTINGFTDGMLLVLKGNAGHIITVKHATGNILLNGSIDFDLTHEDSKLPLIYDAERSKWMEFGKFPH